LDTVEGKIAIYQLSIPWARLDSRVCTVFATKWRKPPSRSCHRQSKA